MKQTRGLGRIVVRCVVCFYDLNKNQGENNKGLYFPCTIAQGIWSFPGLFDKSAHFPSYFICFCSYKIHNTQSTALKICRIHGVFKKHSNVLWNVTAALPLFRLNRSLMHFENTFKAKLETRRKMLHFSSLFILITQKKKKSKRCTSLSATANGRENRRISHSL